MIAYAFRRLIITVGNNRAVLRILYYIWRAFPYRPRRLVTALFIKSVLFQKRAFRVDRQNDITPMKLLGSLSFWGVPQVDLASYRLEVDGTVEKPTSFSLDQIRQLPTSAREVRMDCVGGFRNNTVMEGTSVQALLDRTGYLPETRRVVFHCADGYYVSIDSQELLERDAFIAYSVNGEAIPKFGYPLRLAVPGKYGYQWAKWLVRIELVSDERKGYWAQLGLPDRADVGDAW